MTLIIKFWVGDLVLNKFGDFKLIEIKPQQVQRTDSSQLCCLFNVGAFRRVYVVYYLFLVNQM